MEQVLKAIGWPHLTFLFCLIFLLLFRGQLASLISRITSISKSGVKAESIPEIQREKKKTEAVQELLLVIGNSIVLDDLEKRIRSELIDHGLGNDEDTIKVLIKHFAAAKLLLEFEQIYNLIFGSQIFLLKKLNEVVGQGKSNEFVELHFQHVKELFNKELGGWSFDQYMMFLLGRLLVVNNNGIYHITNFGVEFLTWMARNGRSEARPL
jgi:hypothetical protein